MPRIAWVEDEDAEPKLAQIFARAQETFPGPVGRILRTMAPRPDFLASFLDMVTSLTRFRDGLGPAGREMIFVHVALLNRSQSCLANHLREMRARGDRAAQIAEALGNCDLERAPITPAERLLLEFIGTLTRHAYRITDKQVHGLRDVGWTDAQIADAVDIGAFMNMAVRIADAFGL